MVVGFDAPYRTFITVLPDGTVIARSPKNNAELVSGQEKVDLANKLVQAWSSDMGFAVDQLERLNASDVSGRFLGRLEMQRLGVFGHSLGGAEALQFCHDDSRCKAGIDIDGAPFGSVVREGVTFLDDPDTVVATLTAPTRAIEAEEAEAAEAAAEGEEGEVVEGDAGAGAEAESGADAGGESTPEG